MLAITGIVVQSLGIHFPGEAYTNTDIFGAPATVGWGPNLQIFLFMSGIEIATFDKHYSEDEPGDLGLDGGMLKNMSEADIKKRKEQELAHCRAAMIAVVGATVQTLLFGKLF